MYFLTTVKLKCCPLVSATESKWKIKIVQNCIVIIFSKLLEIRETLSLKGVTLNGRSLWGNNYMNFLKVLLMPCTILIPLYCKSSIIGPTFNVF